MQIISFNSNLYYFFFMDKFTVYVIIQHTKSLLLGSKYLRTNVLEL